MIKKRFDLLLCLEERSKCVNSKFPMFNPQFLDFPPGQTLLNPDQRCFPKGASPPWVDNCLEIIKNVEKCGKLFFFIYSSRFRIRTTVEHLPKIRNTHFALTPSKASTQTSFCSKCHQIKILPILAMVGVKLMDPIKRCFAEFSSKAVFLGKPQLCVYWFLEKVDLTALSSHQ